jgi:hypothetical protein
VIVMILFMWNGWVDGVERIKSEAW